MPFWRPANTDDEDELIAMSVTLYAEGSDAQHIPPEQVRRTLQIFRQTPVRGELWPELPVALELEVSPANVRARALYDRLGFVTKHNTTLRLMRTESAA
jgi:hypothetical protein